MKDQYKKTNLGFAWLFLTISFAIHVVDEAVNDFLHVYNPAVMSIRNTIPFLPIPTFTFEAWLIGLILAILILFALLPFAFRNSDWIIKFSYFYSIIMIINGISHITVSIILGYLMPGGVSSPFILISSIYLLWIVKRMKIERLYKLNVL